MPVEFKDYYAVLGVEKTASHDEIKRAFRGLARKCHPDVVKPGSKSKSEARFKEINEAYEVLKDPEKRRKYDHLGADWETHGEGGFARARSASGDRGRTAGSGEAGGFEYHFGGTGFSDFFEQFFGGVGSDAFVGFDGMGARGSARTRPGPVRGQDVEAEFLVTLEEAFQGLNRRISFRKTDPETGIERSNTIDVKIPGGIREGQRIRLAGQGQAGLKGGAAGDLYLRIRFAQHPDFTVRGSDLYYTLRLTPWQAVLGSKVEVPTLKGRARLTVTEGTQSGKRFRLSGHGLPKADGAPGDLFAEVAIALPERLTERQRAHWEALRDSGS